MGKNDKVYQARLSGMDYALRIVKERGVEALEKECRVRGAHFLPLELTESKIAEINDFLSTRIMNTMLPTILFCLEDKFGFRQKRLERFVDEFEHLCGMITNVDPFGAPYETIGDYASILKERYGLEFDMASIEEINRENREKHTRYLEADYTLDFLERRGFQAAADEIRKYM